MSFQYLKQLLFFAFVFVFIYSNAQSIQFENFEIELKTENMVEKKTLPFKNIVVLDKRFDTAKVGFAFHGHYRNILLSSFASKSIANYLNSNIILVTNSQRTLVLVLKTLWLHELKAGEKYSNGVMDERQNISQCVFRADIYSLEDNNYQALVRIDTIFEDQKSLVSNSVQLLSIALDHAINKVLSLDLNTMFLTKNKISSAQVLSYYDQRFKKPRISNNDINKGIYLTFDDFFNNHATSYKFSIEQDEEADYLYIDDNGEEKLFTDFWGFSDGSNLYTRIGINFFKLSRDQNTYTFWGCQQAIHTTPSRSKNRVARHLLLGNLAELRTAKLKNVLRPMQLDMETGVAY